MEAVVFVTDEARLGSMRKVDLTDQLNYWRHKLLAPKVAAEYSIPNRPHKIAELKRLLALYPNGVVPVCEREEPKRKAPTVPSGPESVLQDMVLTPRVLVDAVGGGTQGDEGGEDDPLYCSDSEDV